MRNYHVCHVCGSKMYPTTEPHKYNFKEISTTISDVHVFRCEKCGEGVLETEEVKRIEEILRKKTEEN